jgi:hypothetical protein
VGTDDALLSSEILRVLLHPPAPTAIPEPRRGTPGDAWGTMFHATRAEYIGSILAKGLAIGGEHSGVMKISAGNPAWADEVYGLRPVFLFIEPTTPDGYTWERSGEEDEVPSWLKVEVRGLALVADLWQLRDSTDAHVSTHGLWWDDGVYYGATNVRLLRLGSDPSYTARACFLPKAVERSRPGSRRRPVEALPSHARVRV